jgi:hypothetical protein
MSKFLKKLLFWLFIILVVVAVGYLASLAYTDANCSRGVTYIVEQYEVKSNEIKTIKYQEYVYEDIANCDSLWLKKCTSEQDLLFEYTIDIDGTKIVIKEYKDGVFEDNYEKGTIRKEYLEKHNKDNVSDEVIESN